MRLLLLHPDDDLHGPWKNQRWDWVVDLGRAPRSLYDEWSAALGCPVSSIYDFALEVEDLQTWRSLFALGMGRVVDHYGVDWWDVIGLLLHPEMQDIRLAIRLAAKLADYRAIATSRPSSLADALQMQLGIPLQVFQSGIWPRVANRLSRYKTALVNLTSEQLRQVAYDKFDAHYRWRRKFAPMIAPSSEPVILLPSAYSNVTRTALKYARILPARQFVLVLARESAAVSPLPANVRPAPLAAFANEPLDTAELRELEESWLQLERLLGEHPEFTLPVRLGIVHQGLNYLRWGLSMRNAWSRVFETHSISACLSADDTNPYSRVPLILAAQRGIPAVACHHGALDCRMAFKVPRFSTYLVQGEMERDYLTRVCRVDSSQISVGSASSPPESRALWRNDASWIVFFTEPYETDGWRVAAIYREILPRLCSVARKSGKTVVLKLHPFETAKQRRRLVKAILTEADQALVRIIASPISPEIFRNTWCAVTVESTVAVECSLVGIPAFLCGWLRHAYSGYAHQYARFGVGRILEAPADLLNISQMMEGVEPALPSASRLFQPISPEALEEVLSQPVARDSR